jgi:excisionase family DNA binding protein
MALSVAEASQRQGLSARRIRRLVASGEVKGWRLSARFWRVDERSLQRYRALNVSRAEWHGSADIDGPRGP